MAERRQEVINLKNPKKLVKVQFYENFSLTLLGFLNKNLFRCVHVYILI